jgi:transketolase
MSVNAVETQSTPDVTHKDMANSIRALAMDAVEKANSGHPGMPMGMADVATVLFSKFMKFDPSTPNWPDRDRFILSNGHGSMLLYALNYLTGYEQITLDEIKNFRQLHSKTPGHPEYDIDSGIETTTGPLGQGLANGVGMALAEKMMDARFGNDLVDHYTYVFVGDGCLMEGISHEACSLAGHLKLGKLIVLYDDNGISIDGSTDLSFTDDTPKRFEAYGWDVVEIDGHDPEAITKAIAESHLQKDKPSLICCKTRIGFGAPTKEGSAASHGSPLGPDEIKGARENIGWSYDSFEIPDHILNEWRGIGRMGIETRKAWEVRLDSSDDALRSKWFEMMSQNIAPHVQDIIRDFKHSVSEECPKVATRKASGNILEKLIPAMPQLIGGSADLTGSVNTLIEDMGGIMPDDFSGRYIYYGVREHAMAAMMNGMALHKGIIPYSGTFLSFTDYCRPSIRLSALMQQRVIYVMTHDSIGLGEDGPTHQPVEHLASLRAMPNLLVLRPADAVETAECWEIALEHKTGPSILALTRQGLPTVRLAHNDENKCAKGAYILNEADGEAQAVIYATGSEIEIALQAQEQLKQDGIAVRVVSVPSFELFFAQSKKYIEDILPQDLPKVAIEAACGFGWEKFIGHDGAFIGMNSFGDSAPADVLYEHFGITATAAVKAIKDRI